jgi:hypothetical protein
MNATIGEAVIKNGANKAMKSIKDSLPTRKARPAVKSKQELSLIPKAKECKHEDAQEDKRSHKQKKLEIWLGKLDNFYTILSAEDEGK